MSSVIPEMRQQMPSMDPQRPAPRTEHDHASAQATLGRSLRPVRIVLSLTFVAVVITTPGHGVVSFGLGTSLVLAAVGIVNAAVNAAGMLGLADEGTRRYGMPLQIAADSLIALTGMLLLDAAATPLAWIALLLPVFDAGVAFGALAAGLAWASLSLAYVVSRLQIDSPGVSGDANVLGLALQQLAAVAVVAIPTAYVAARLRDDLAESHRARIDANRRAEELLVVGTAAQKLATTTDSFEVLDIALDCVVALGFARADACEKRGDRPWRLLRAAGSHHGPDPVRNGDLDEAVARNRAVTTGIGEAPPDSEELRLLGYRAGAVFPVGTSPGYAIALRAWSTDPIVTGSSALESLDLVVSLTAGAWRNATTLSRLESWSNDLTRRATHDELTGLANRAHLFTSVEDSLERMRQTGVKFAALFLDLDGFKGVNDELGHEAGDAVLRTVAERLTRQVRGHDVLARLGGDEFVVVLNELDDPRHAMTVAGRICRAVAAPFSIDGSVATLGASVGIAYAQPGDSADRVLNSADRVMYEAKRQGGNRFIVSRPNAA